jgi:hypothetical protein
MICKNIKASIRANESLGGYLIKTFLKPFFIGITRRLRADDKIGDI